MLGKVGIFSQISNCIWLSLDYNEIQRIESRTFNGLISLKFGKIESSWGYSLSICLDLNYNEIGR